jgi:hypothetical protein
MFAAELYILYSVARQLSEALHLTLCVFVIVWVILECYLCYLRAWLGLQAVYFTLTQARQNILLSGSGVLYKQI